MKRTPPEEHKKYWRIGQWVTTGFRGLLGCLHDMANTAYSHRDSSGLMVMILPVFVAHLLLCPSEGGGKIPTDCIRET